MQHIGGHRDARQRSARRFHGGEDLMPETSGRSRDHERVVDVRVLHLDVAAQEFAVDLARNEELRSKTTEHGGEDALETPVCAKSISVFIRYTSVNLNVCRTI